MESLPRLDDDFDLLVSYSIRDGETVSEAIVHAFAAVDVDPFDRETTLQDWIDPDALEGLDWTADRPLYVSARIWNHRVAITADEVRIYTDPLVE